MIYVQRRPDQDASWVAAQAAWTAGTHTVGCLRWYGAEGPTWREINTMDGQGVRVYEPGYEACPPETIRVD